MEVFSPVMRRRWRVVVVVGGRIGLADRTAPRIGHADRGDAGNRPLLMFCWYREGGEGRNG